MDDPPLLLVRFGTQGLRPAGSAALQTLSVFGSISPASPDTQGQEKKGYNSDCSQKSEDLQGQWACSCPGVNPGFIPINSKKGGIIPGGALFEGVTEHALFPMGARRVPCSPSRRFIAGFSCEDGFIPGSARPSISMPQAPCAQRRRREV